MVSRSVIGEMQVLVDFYNLHLKSGRQYRPPSRNEDLSKIFREGRLKKILGKTLVTKEVIWPDRQEREQLLNFFAGYSPQARSYADAKSVESHRSPQGAIDLVPGVFGSLSWYEDQNKKNWFESEDYLDFVDHWRNLRDLLDSIIARQLDLYLFIWFRTEALHWKEPRLEGQPDKKGYTHNVGLINPKGEPKDVWSLYFDDGILTVPLCAWKIEKLYTFDKTRFGLAITGALYKIYQFIIHLMEEPTPLEQCQAEETPRRAACTNIFWHNKRPGPKNRYCSDKCRRRDYEAKKAKRKSNELRRE